MSKISTEEKSPLLFVDDKYDEIPPARKVQFENSRFKGIYSGATTVFTHFPDYTGSCWIITAFCGLTFFMMMLLFVGTITTTSLRLPRCTPADEQSNKTVVLVHPFNPGEWKLQEFEMLDKILKTYQGYTIQMICIHQEIPRTNTIYKLLNISEGDLKLESTTSTPLITTTTKTGKKKETRRKRKLIDYRLNVDVEARKLLDLLFKGKIMDKLYTEKPQVSEKQSSVIPENTSIRSIDDLTKLHPNLLIENTTFNQIFFNSPLYGYWSEMNNDLKIFAVRVLQLWQNGGISFDLHPSIPNKKIQIRNTTNNTEENVSGNTQKVVQFIANGKNKFESLPENVVVADDEGMHMMSKIPCHVFFGQILTNLRKAKRETTIKDVMKSSISVFCKNYAAQKEYCDKLLSS